MNSFTPHTQARTRRFLDPARRKRSHGTITPTVDLQQCASAAVPLPAELPALPANPRVALLIDGDCVSRGLVEGTARSRASNQEVNSCLDQARATAMLLDPHTRARCACSSATAINHLDVLTAFHNNLFTIRRSVDGADWALVEELTDLIDACNIAAARPRRPSVARVDLVILVGQDGIYAKALRQLRLLGVPGWVLTPGRLAAASLARAACAVTYIGPSLFAYELATPIESV